VLRAAGETETKQENMQYWLKLDEGGPEFQLLAEKEIDAVLFFYFHQHSLYYQIFYLFVF
jgi:hypothetical protein